MILYRHILKAHVLPFIYALALILFMFIMQLAVDLLDKILSKGLAFSTVMEILCMNLAWMAALAVPMAVLVATLTAFGTMSADNEIVAIKASGQNLRNAIVPVFLAAGVIAVLLLFFNDLVLPEANHRSSNLMADISRKKPSVLIEPRVLIRDFKDYAIYVNSVEGRSGKLRGIKIFSDVAGQDPTTTVADSGEVHVTKDGKYLALTLYSGESHSIKRENPQEYYVGRFDRQVIFVENVDSELRHIDRDFRGDREKNNGLMLSEVSQFKRERGQYMQEHDASVRTLVSQIGRLDSLSRAPAKPNPHVDSAATFDQWLTLFGRELPSAVSSVQRQTVMLDRTIRRVSDENMKINQNMVEVHKKYSIAVTCLVFVLLGAPLGIMAHRGGLAVGATYSVFFFVVYWAFLIAGEALADRCVISPAVAMWSGNVLIGAVGCVLVVRMIRETTFISFAPLQRLWYRIVHVRAVVALARGVDFVKSLLFGLPIRLLNAAAGLMPTYVIRLFFGYILGVFAALTVTFVAIDYISNIHSFQNATFRQVVLYYWYYLAWFIQLIAPIGILLACMFSMGKLAKSSELIAIKAAGVSIRRVTMPLVFLGLVLVGASFSFSEKVLPTANERRRELSDEMQQGREHQQRLPAAGQPSFHRNFYYFGRSNVVYCFQEFSTHPQRSRDVWRETFAGNRIVERVQADKLLFDDKGKWFFVKATRRTFIADSTVIAAYDTLADTLLAATPDEMVARIKGVDEMSYWELREAVDKAQKRGENTAHYQSDLDFKIALPFMNLIVILLGVSITARAGRRGASGLFGIGLLMVFSYWVLARFGLALGEDERLPPLVAAWGGNVLFFLLSLVLYRRASQ